MACSRSRRSRGHGLRGRYRHAFVVAEQYKADEVISQVRCYEVEYAHDKLFLEGPTCPSHARREPHGRPFP